MRAQGGKVRGRTSTTPDARNHRFWWNDQRQYKKRQIQEVCIKSCQRPFRHVTAASHYHSTVTETCFLCELRTEAAGGDEEEVEVLVRGEGGKMVGKAAHYCQVTAGQLRLLLTVAWTQYLILIPPSSTSLPLIDEILSALVRLTPPDSTVFDNVSRHHRAPALLRSLRASPFDELCFYRNEMKTKSSPNWCLIQRRLNRGNSSAIFNVTRHVKLLSNSVSESVVDRSLNNISPSHQHWSHFIRIPRPKGGRCRRKEGEREEGWVEETGGGAKRFEGRAQEMMQLDDREV